MEPDTLKKQTCYRESVYILFFPSLSLSASLLAPLSQLTVAWLFHFTVSVAMVVKRESLDSQPIPFFDRDSLYVCRRGVPLRGQYCLDAQPRCGTRRRGHNRTRQGMNFNLTHRESPKQSPRFFSGEGNKIQRNINSLNIYCVNSVFALW